MTTTKKRSCKNGLLKRPVKSPNGRMRYCKKGSKSRKQPRARSRIRSRVRSRVRSKKQPRARSKKQPRVRSRKQPRVRSRKQPRVRSRKQPIVRSRKQPRVRSRKQPRGCVEINEHNSTPSKYKKYSNRRSPPYPANECIEGMRMVGNDGNMYGVSKPSKNGVKRWIKI